MVNRLFRSGRTIRTNPLDPSARPQAEPLVPDVTLGPLGDQMRELRQLRAEGRITDAEYAVEASAVLLGRSRLSGN